MTEKHFAAALELSSKIKFSKVNIIRIEAAIKDFMQSNFTQEGIFYFCANEIHIYRNNVILVLDTIKDNEVKNLTELEKQFNEL